MSSCLFSGRDYKGGHLLFPEEICHVAENIKYIKPVSDLFNPNKMYKESANLFVIRFSKGYNFYFKHIFYLFFTLNQSSF